MLSKLKVKFHSLATDTEGNTLMTFKVDTEYNYTAKTVASLLRGFALKGKELFSLVLAEWREKRSLDANAYAWVLMGKIAEILRMDKEQVYLNMLQRYGVFTHVVVKPQIVDRVQQEWRTSKVLGEVTVNGHTGVQIQCYFGSSTYNTKEMSVLIDGIVSECKEMEIPTETPEELARMKGEWGR